MPAEDRPTPPKLPRPIGRWPWGLILFGLLALWALQAVWTYPWSDPRTVQVSYSQIKDMIRDGRIARVTLGDTTVRGEGTETAPATPADRVEGSKLPALPRLYVAVRVPGDETLVPLLEEKHVPYQGEVESGWLKDGWIAWLLPIGLLVLFWSFMLRRMAANPGGPGVMTFGKSRAKVYAESETKITFEDVAGQEEAKSELQEIIEFLKKPEKFRALGAKIPKGVLLVGPPGTGKTLMARAVAGEAGVPFFSISGSDFVEMFVGVGAARVRDLFQQAEAKAPCIIFVDELDALGKARGMNPMVGHDEREQTLNQLLAEMDGFDGRKGVIVVAATNRPETLDPALMRAGRFDRQIVVDRPDVRGREAILRVHSRKVKMSKSVDLKLIATRTPGFTGADLSNLINEAALHAARVGRKEVFMDDFEASIDRVIAGIEKKSRVISPRERTRVAHHEAGHAVVAAYTPGSDRVHKISIIPRGIGALGFTMQLPEEDRYLMTRAELLGKMDVLLGGRVAEEIIFHEVSTGAQDDLQRSTDIARRMITEFGMSESFPNVTLTERRSMFLDVGMSGATREYSEATARIIDNEVKGTVADAHERATTLLTQKVEIVKRVAAALLVEETIEGPKLQALLGLPPTITPDGEAVYPPAMGEARGDVIQSKP
jgi:cell division protease FtsH